MLRELGMGRVRGWKCVGVRVRGDGGERYWVGRRKVEGWIRGVLGRGGGGRRGWVALGLI